MVTEIKKDNEYRATKEGAVSCVSYNNIENHSFGNGFFIGGIKMDNLKMVGMIEEAHGHKGAVKVKSLCSESDEMLKSKNVYLVDGRNNAVAREIFEVKKYRRNRMLVKFKGLKGRSEIEGLSNLMLAVV